MKIKWIFAKFGFLYQYLEVDKNFLNVEKAIFKDNQGRQSGLKTTSATSRLRDFLAEGC